MSCTICHKQCKSYEDEMEDEQDMIQEIVPQHEDDALHHFLCAELAPLKHEFENIFVVGSTNACPNCGLRGQKDEDCCHMVCDKCDQEWCYCCERKLESNEVTTHFYGDLQVSKDCCPQYLNFLNEIDEDFEDFEPVVNGGQEKCVALYHRQKTMYLLQKHLEKQDIKQVEKLLKQFSGLLNGISIEDIKNFELKECLNGRINRIPASS